MSIVVSPSDIRHVEITGLDEREYSKDDLPSVLFIDEATHFTNGELQVISDFAAKNNVAVVMLGDTEQSGKSQLWRLRMEMMM